jgi:predicted RNase H-like HicB family nuclease
MEYKVSLTWDDEAYVWLASSADVPGLALESGSLDALMERVKVAIPDLLDLKNTDLTIDFQAERMAQVHV